MSQPWQEMTWPERKVGRGAGPRGGLGGAWSRNRIVLPGQPPGRGEPEAPRPPVPDGGKDGRQSTNRRPGALLTGRGAVLGMFVLFSLGILVATWMNWSPLAAASFVVGCAAAAWWTKPRDLLSVVVSPPILFFCALLGVKALTATGNTLVSVAGGTVLTLAVVAPWLLVGAVISVIIAWSRGLPRCVSDLRRATHGDLQADRAWPTKGTRPAGPTGPRSGSAESG